MRNFLFGLFLVAAVAQAADPALELAGRLSQAGSPQLALRELDAAQPNLMDEADQLAAERLRLSLLVTLERHEDILKLGSQLRADLPEDFLRGAYLAAAQAAQKLGQAAQMRHYAGLLLWLHPLQPAEHAALRRLVVESYLLEGRANEAYLAQLRYQQDGLPADKVLLTHLVEAMLHAGMARDAGTWLNVLDEGPLKLQLRLETGLVTPEAALAEARKLLAKSGNIDYWRVVLRVARMRQDRPLAIEAEEQLLHTAAKPTASAMRDLWRDYLELAESAANQAGLLTGDDPAWVSLAIASLRGSPPTARALLAYLLAKRRDGLILLEQQVAQLPVDQSKDLLLALGDVAASDGRYELAARCHVRALMQASPREVYGLRMKAAASLERAGLMQDAKRQYQLQLKACKDPAQQEAVRRALAKLP